MKALNLFFTLVFVAFAATASALTVTISAGGPTTFCTGNQVKLTGSVSPYGLYQYQWKRNGVNISGAITFVYYATTSGNYVLRVTNANNNVATSNSITVTVNPLPVVTVSPGGNIVYCNFTSATLTASAATSYLWSNAATTQSITVSTPGAYSVIVTNAAGCSSTSIPVIVNPPVQSGVALTPPCGAFAQKSMGGGTYAVFNVLSGVSYSFSTCGTAFDTELSGFSPGNNNVFYNNDNGPDCAGTAASVNWISTFSGTLKVMLTSYPCQGYNIWAPLSAILKYKQNNNLAFTSSGASMLPGSTRTLTATPGGGTFSGIGVVGNVFTAPALPGNYGITYTRGQCNVTQVILVSLTMLPQKENNNNGAMYDMLGGNVISGEKITLPSTFIADEKSGDASAVSISSSSTEADAENNNIEQVELKSNPATVSIGLPQAMELSIYPNPNDGSFSIEFSLPAMNNVSLKIMNNLGQVVFSREYQQLSGNNKIPVSLGENARGIYLVKIQTEEGVMMRRVVVE